VPYPVNRVSELRGKEVLPKCQHHGRGVGNGAGVNQAIKCQTSYCGNCSYEPPALVRISLQMSFKENQDKLSFSVLENTRVANEESTCEVIVVLN
jgi:hypothetical protein